MINIFDDKLDNPNVIIVTKIKSFDIMPNSVYIFCFENNHNKNGVLELSHTHPKFDSLYDKLKVGNKYQFKIICQYILNYTHTDLIYDIIER